MSDPESFLSRWSRRKREVSHEAEAANPPAATDEPAQDDHASGKVSPNPAPAAVDPPLDPASLPSIESITATTDIRAFLSAGVPADLARAALRRAWSSDPAIRDFIGLSENSWDFNAPGGIPGFGPIDPAEVGRLVAQAIGKPEVAAAAGDACPPPTQTDQPQPCESGQTATAGDASAASDQRPELQDHRAVASEEIMQRTKADAAVQEPPERSEDAVTSPRRSHGGALPD
jgi:Protein of unknown function (DUF3306)